MRNCFIVFDVMTERTRDRWMHLWLLKAKEYTAGKVACVVSKLSLVDMRFTEILVWLTGFTSSL